MRWRHPRLATPLQRCLDVGDGRISQLVSNKTNAMRELEKAKVSYSLREFPVGDEHLDGVQVAELVGLAPERVYKTLCARGDKTGPLFAVLPSICELDLKALAKLSNNRKVNMVPLAEVTPITGYVRGSTTALASKKRLPVFLHEAVLQEQTLCVSAGRRGLQMELAPQDYIRVTRAKTGAIAR